MDAYQILILLCGLVVFSYLFDLVAKHARVPAVILLLGLGMALRYAADRVGMVVPNPGPLLPALGTMGLIMIVFEGALELTVDHSQNKLIRKAFTSALVTLLITTGILAVLAHYYLGASWLAAFANAVPFAVISSAVAIPSVADMSKGGKEFIVFESTFSDILAIILFNFVTAYSITGSQAFTGLGFGLLGVLVLSAVFSMLLLLLMGRLNHHVKSFLIIAILVLVYAVGKQLHLSTLLVVLAFGIFLANADRIPWEWFKQRFLYPTFNKDLELLHSLSMESAFLIRTFFFILFGFTLQPADALHPRLLVPALALLTTIYVVRFVWMRAVVRMNDHPLTLIAPRGLITILLYLSLPENLKLDMVGPGILFITVIATTLIMAIGLAVGKREKA